MRVFSERWSLLSLCSAEVELGSFGSLVVDDSLHLQFGYSQRPLLHCFTVLYLYSRRFCFLEIWENPETSVPRKNLIPHTYVLELMFIL